MAKKKVQATVDALGALDSNVECFCTLRIDIYVAGDFIGIGSSKQRIEKTPDAKQHYKKSKYVPS